MENFLYGKIVYLDEQAVFDFLELHQNGIQSDIIKHVSENMVKVDAEGKVGMSLLTRLKIGFSGNASYQRSGVVESQITSTLLSNLKKLVINKESSSKVEYLDNIKLFIEKDSPAFYRNITPVLDMISDIEKMNSFTDDDKNNFKGIEIKNIERTLDRLSGYYEIKGISSDNKEMILRFNISGLRNNYTLSDLTKMDIKLYGIKVGKIDSIDLSFNTMIDRLSRQNQSKIGIDFDAEQEDNMIPIYDILVAGV
ncbi:DUF6414 family protein [Streptococcus salivarius]|uniref:DUF6414 family protein n=1 Tax=Streptococcus salivarius TaxID=1304 RepID=UPI001581F854|nr:DUF6414 family protein [Streptococcus salivarius]